MSVTRQDDNRFISRLDEALRTGRPIDLRAVLEGALPSDDECVADVFRCYGDSVRSEGVRLELEEFVRAAPWLFESEVSIDAAIDECLESALALGEHLAGASSSLLRAHPLAGPAVRRAVILRESLGDPEDGRGTALVEAMPRLPAEFGPPDLDGRPRYELRSVIGMGGQGVVFAAVDRLFSETTRAHMVAVKVFHERSLRNTSRSHPDSLEAQRASRIRHDGIVRPLDRGVDRESRPYAVYELVDGLSLDEFVSQHEQMPVRGRVGMVLQLAEAVEAAHAAGVVHRDLKPPNIIVGRDRRAKIADFGISRSIGMPLDREGRYSSRGSLAFMSPEHFLGLPEGEAPGSDVYGLAGLLYWILTDEFPNGPDVAAAVHYLETGGGTRRRYPVGVPGSLQRICERGLAYRADSRHRSAASFASDLRAWLEHRPIAWMGDSRPTLAALFVRRNPKLTLACALGVIGIAVSAASIAIVQQRGERRVAAQAELLERQRLEAELELQGQQLADREERIEQARRLVSQWSKLILHSDGFDPARYVAMLGMLGSMGVADDALRLELLANSAIAAVEKADELSQQEVGTLELGLWELVAGANLMDSGEIEQGRVYLERANRTLTALVGEDDPIVQGVRGRLEASP